MKVSVDTIEITVDKCRLRFCRTYNKKVCAMTSYETTERDEEPSFKAKWLAEIIAKQHFTTLEKIRIKNWNSKKRKKERLNETGDLF